MFRIAKGAAYSALLAFFPVLASIAAILAKVNADSVAHVFSRILFEVVPPGTEDLVRYQFAARGQRPIWLVLAAAVLSAWAASGAMISLMEGFQAAYHLPSGRSFLRQRGIAILLVFIAALPSVGASAMLLFGARTERWMLGWLGLAPEADIRTGVILAFDLLRYLVALGAIVVVTALMYWIGPNRPLRFGVSGREPSCRRPCGWAPRPPSLGMCATSPTITCCMEALGP